MIRVVVSGACGKMGKAVTEMIKTQEEKKKNQQSHHKICLSSTVLSSTLEYEGKLNHYHKLQIS